MSASDDEFCNCDWGTQKEEVPTPPPPPPPPPPEQMPLPSASVNGFSNRNWGNTQNRKEKPSQPPPPSQQARLGSASDDEFCNSDWGTQKEEVPPPPPPEQVPMPSSSGNGFSNCDWGNTQNRKGKPPQPLPQEAVNGFSNCNWGNTQNRKEVPPPPPPQQMPMPSSSANGFSNCDWGTQKKKVPPPPPPPQQMPLPSACPCPCPCPGVQTRPITPSNILYVEGIEEYRNQLPLLRVEEIARVFFLHIPNVNVVDVKRLLHWDDNHYAVVELDTVDHAKKAISILNGITLSTGHTLTVYFCNLSVSLAPSNSALLRLKAERRRNDSRIVFVEEPVEGEKFSGAQDETTAPQQPFSNGTEEEDADDDDATSEYSSCSSGNACVRPNTIDSDSEAASGSEEETNDEDE